MFGRNVNAGLTMSKSLLEKELKQQLVKKVLKSAGGEERGLTIPRSQLEHPKEHKTNNGSKDSK
jgi:hypothetical protein